MFRQTKTSLPLKTILSYCQYDRSDNSQQWKNIQITKGLETPFRPLMVKNTLWTPSLPSSPNYFRYIKIHLRDTTNVKERTQESFLFIITKQNKILSTTRSIKLVWYISGTDKSLITQSFEYRQNTGQTVKTKWEVTNPPEIRVFILYRFSIRKMTKICS